MHSLRGLTGDMRQALRQMRKSIGFTAVVVLTLALGIGANTTVFSVVDAVLLRPLPYAAPERLMEVESWNSHKAEPSNFSYPDYLDLRAQNHSFEHLVSYHDHSFTLTGVPRAMHIDGEVVAWDLLPMLGVSPELGRGFTPDEEKRGTKVVLLSHALWQSAFAADRNVLGRTIALSGKQYTVIGVMPSGFRFPVNVPENGVWTTLAVDENPITNRGMHWLNAMGKLKPGVTAAQADQDLRAIAGRLAMQYPETNTKHDSARVDSELRYLLGDTRTLMLVIEGAVGLVLLIACGNIGNLLLARVRERQREIAMRSALGAARWRIIRQLLLESIVLSVTGGMAGCLLAYAATPAVLRLIGDSVPRAADAGVNGVVLIFGLAVSLLAGLAFSVIPAITASKTDLVSNLKSGSRAEIAGHDRLRAAVVVGQVALGIVLTAGAALLISSFVRRMHTELGFDPNHLLTYRFETPDSRYETTRNPFYRAYFDKLRALPGVESAAGVLMLPMGSDSADVTFEDAEHPLPAGARPSVTFNVITPGYFHTLNVPVLQGRDFKAADDEHSNPVVIVNQAFADKYFPNEQVLGKRIKPGAGNGGDDTVYWREIVGVVGNLRESMMQKQMRPAYYAPAAQLDRWCCLSTVLRVKDASAAGTATTLDPMSLEPAARQLVSSIDSEIPVTDMKTMPEMLSLQLAQPRFAMVLLGAFAALALLLTVVGLYGVMTYTVTRRTREIGVRLALGAQRSSVLTMVLRDAAQLLGIGIIVGLASALAMGSVLRSMLFATTARDPIILATVCVLVAAAGLLAAYLPAMRASHVEPVEALRME